MSHPTDRSIRTPKLEPKGRVADHSRAEIDEGLDDYLHPPAGLDDRKVVGDDEAAYDVNTYQYLIRQDRTGGH